MHFILKKEKLVNILNKFNTYIIKDSKNIILSNILINLFEKKLHLIVTNLDIEINFFIVLSRKEFIKNGSITVNLYKLYKLCFSYPKEEYIDLNYINNRLCISCLNIKTFLSTLPIDDFPLINKKIIYNNNISISSIYLKEIISSIYFSMGNQDIYFYLNGMLIEFFDYFLYFVTTDSYRISIYKLLNNFINITENSFSIIIPRNLVLELLKLLNFINNENIFFYFNKNTIKIIFGNFIIYSNLIDGNFPDYKNILFLFKKHIYIDLNILDFKNALIRNSIISNNFSNYVTLNFSKNKLFIYTNDSNNNEIKEYILINYSGKNIEISFNIKYILDILKYINVFSKIRFFLKDSSSIVKIININNILLTYMVMPIQL